MFHVQVTWVSLCFAPLVLVACLDEGDASMLAEERLTQSTDPSDESLASTSMEVAQLPQTPRSTVGQDADNLTITYPEALCNDGQPPIVKIREDEGGGKNWLIYLGGGGGCNSIDTCYDRWKDCDPTPTYGIGGQRNMKPLTGPRNFDDDGILDFDGEPGEPSPFAGKGFNRVYVHYCSSDQWRGLGHSHDVDFPDICGSVGLDELHFAGGKIVEGVVDMVMNHELAPEAGNFIVLAGGSGGGNGVQYNLDRVALQASGVTVLGISDASFGIGLDQDAIPDGNSVESELFWAGLDPSSVLRSPGDAIDVVVDESCIDDEFGAAKDYCHSAPYVTLKHVSSPLLLTSNSYDKVVHRGALDTLIEFWPSDCNALSGSSDEDAYKLYATYCDPLTDPTQDIKTWIRYQIAHDGAALLNPKTNLAYYIVHSSRDLHDQLLKKSSAFYRRASDFEMYNELGGYEFAGLGGWTSLSGQNVDPSVASTVACALGLVGVPGAPTCGLADVRVTSDLPVPVPVIENYLN